MSGDITSLLQQLNSGEGDAARQLMPLVYEELHRIAAFRLRNERADHTLQPTALVHEVFLRLAGGTNVDWQNRAHFFAVAARMMRRILVDHARSAHSVKRGGFMTHEHLDECFVYVEERSADLLALDEVLNQLGEFSPRQANLVEMRFFGGLTEEEIACVLGVSSRTVKRDWRIARAWLRSRLEP